MGTRECSCREGYYLDKFDKASCYDVDECAQNNGNCPTNSKCVNSEGSYKCECDTGYQEIAGQCFDIDECEISTTSPCPDDLFCQNTVGSFKCVNCGVGFTYLEDGSCLDINECDFDNGQCSDHCKNTQGSFICSCDAGFELDYDRLTCKDINECKLNKNLCKGPGAECSNSPGSYQCICSESGYQLDKNNHTCVDIDECLTIGDKCGYARKCVNKPGSYDCICIKGFRLDPIKNQCVPDSNSVEKATGCPIDNNCEHICNPVFKSDKNAKQYECSCFENYVLSFDGTSCIRDFSMTLEDDDDKTIVPDVSEVDVFEVSKYLHLTDNQAQDEHSVICPMGWTAIGGNFLHHSKPLCYFVATDSHLSQPEAKEFCQGTNSTLAIINDKEQNHYLGKLLKTESFWIGLEYQDFTKKFHWQDEKNNVGEVLDENFGKVHWIFREPQEVLPDVLDNTCVMSNYGELGKWSNEACVFEAAFACSKTGI